MEHPPRFLAICEDARTRIEETDVETVKARLERGDDFLLIDTREDREWNKGHLPGAIHIGKGVIERDIEAKVPELDREMILYCGGGYRSALAADNLIKMGYTRAISMDGGFRGWKDAGYEIVTEE
ncbi:MAG: rhodanese-like domain-containing protein [Pseudomonadales bacterium]|jgi:rhodanese-related sulfurtransferase